MRFSFLSNDIKSMKYYGSGDLAGGVFLKNVINSIELLESNIEELNDDIYELEDLYRYMWLLSFKEMVVEIDKYLISEEIKNKIKSLDLKINYSPGRVIKYINENYKVALDKNNIDEVRWYEFYDILMNIIYGKYSGGINEEVFEYIEKNYALDILAYYEKYSKYYEKHRESLKKLFSGLQKTKVFDDQIYTAFLINNKINDGFYDEQAKFICERTLSHIKSLTLSSDNNDILQIKSFFYEYRKLAILYNLKCANDYNEYMNTIDRITDEYLKKHGKKIDVGPVNFQNIIEHFKSSNEMFRFIQLTHSMKNDKILNNFNSILTEKNTSVFSEFVNRLGVNKSEKYPYFKQDSMELHLWININILNLLLNDLSLVSDYVKYFSHLSYVVQNDFFHDSVDVTKELVGIYEIIANIIELIKNNQEQTYLCKALINGCVMNECGYIEKLLRNVALFETKDHSYFDQDANTLGNLFKHHKYKSLSDGLLYYLEFYLSKENNEKIRKDERPGKNIRNIQMHNHDEKYESTTFELCLVLYYFILSILGDLYIWCDSLKQNSQ